MSISTIQWYSFDIGLMGNVNIHFIEEIIGGSGEGSQMFSSSDGLLGEWSLSFGSSFSGGSVKIFDEEVIFLLMV